MAQFRHVITKICRLTSRTSNPPIPAAGPRPKIFSTLSPHSPSDRTLKGVVGNWEFFKDRPRFVKLLSLGIGLGICLGFAASTTPATVLSEAPPDRTPTESRSGIMGGPVITRSGKFLPKLKIFVGYDPREDLAYEVCRHSILKHATFPVEVIPIKQSDLRSTGLYWRDRGPTESTEFSFTRFLTPFLAGFDGWAMFVDCDFLYTADIRELAELIDDKYAIMCVQHDYKPKTATKMDGVVQTTYPRKNWSSMVLYNCEHPKNRVLTPSVVNSQSGAFLHRFMWLDDGDIGSVPCSWNFLVGHNEVDEKDPGSFPRAIHYTLGGPWFEAWKDCQFADLWLQEVEELKRTQMIQKVIQSELVGLLDRRMEDRARELEARVEDLEGKVNDISSLQKLLLFYLQNKFLANNGNGGAKERPVDA